MIKALTVGTATRDVFIQSQLFKVVHDPTHLEKLGFPTGEAQCFALGGKIEVGRPAFTIGGGAANAAVTFSRQGFKAEALIKIGRDPSGRDVISHLKDEKVGVRAVLDSKAGTAYSAILLSPGGERTILNYRGASEDLRLNDFSTNTFKVQVGYIVPGRIPFEVIKKIVQKLRVNGAFVAMNPSKYYLEMGAKKLKPIFDNLDLILVNREEGAYLTGAKYEDERGIFKKFDKLVRGLAVMTDGPKGVMVSDGQKIYQAGIYKEKKIVDRTGAGDAFGSGFAAGLLRQVSSILEKKSKISNGAGKYQVSSNRNQFKFNTEAIEYAIRLGSANATSVVEAIGAEPGILTQKQFKNETRWGDLKIKVEEI